MKRISIVIPARDEAKTLPGCFAAIDRAAAHAGIEPERIVVVNRCTDDTEAVARAGGAVIVHDEGRNLAAIRNAGGRAATGDILVTVDADSLMSENMLSTILGRLANPRVVGGGVMIWPERFSVGVVVMAIALLPLALWHRISCGLFWCRKTDFDAIGGFDERFVSVEDIDFARRLKRHGKRTGRRRFQTLLRAHIVTSCRKFDTFGEWHVLRHPRLMWKLMRGRDQDAANRYWYDFKH